MATTNGQKVAMYLLLTSRSELRLMLEGKVKSDGTVAENQSPVPVPDSATLVTNFLGLVNTRFGIAETQFNTGKLPELFESGATDPNGATTNVTNKARNIRIALDMSGPYPDNSPCPEAALQHTLFNAIVPAVP